MKKTPAGWPRISSALFYEEPGKAIDWLCAAFGFEVRIKVEHGGAIVHSELVYGEGLIMVGGAGKARTRPEATHCKSPREIGGANTQSMMIYVDDVETHCERARQAGAKIISEPKTTDYGEEYWADHGYEAEDEEGHRWWFMQRVRDPKSA